MIEKRIKFHTHDSLGRCFAEAIDIMPRSGGGIEKVAGQLHPDLQRYVSSLRSDPKYQYVLMTPMGAFEYWGMNVNGDVFPEIALQFDYRTDDPAPVARELEAKYLSPFGNRAPSTPVKEFGYRTFINALRYQNHVNKNPSVSYGDITFVVYNSAMHRVELVARHNREDARRVGAEEIIRDLDMGKPRQISMGCKVPFDVCTICGHISRTPRDYCGHLKTQMGRILPDGKIVGAVNFFPRFFDLSDVFVPAAKESGVLMKVAHVSQGREKVSSVKEAEVEKNILPNASAVAVRNSQAVEPDLPRELLKKEDLGELLSTMALLGMIMKPKEFQYGLLNRMGRGSLADRLHRERRVFSHEPRREYSRGVIRSSDYSPSLARTLSDFIPHRSGFYPHLPSRIIRITIRGRAPPLPMHDSGPSPLLSKVANAYSDYRSGLKNITNEIEKTVFLDSELFTEYFFNELLVSDFTKTATLHNVHPEFGMVESYFQNAYSNSEVGNLKIWSPKTSSSFANALFGYK